METRASYVMVGAFVLGLIAAGVVFVLWLAGREDTTHWKYFNVHFKGSVTGLQVGSVVRYRGIPMGEVETIRIAPSNNEIIEVFIKVKREAPVYKKTKATIESQGITGGAFLQLSGVKLSGSLLKTASKQNKKGENYAVIDGEPSGLDLIFQEFPKAIAAITKLANRASLMLDKPNRDNFAAILKNANKAVIAFKQVGDDIKPLMKSLQPVVKGLGRLEGTLTTTAKDFSTAAKGVDGAAKSVSGAAKEFGIMNKQLTLLIRQNHRPISDFANSGLHELTLFLTETRVFMRTATRLFKRMENDPSGFFFGNRQKGYRTR